MSDKPTKKWLEAQINGCQRAIAQNEGAMNLCRAMLDNGIYVEEEVKNDGMVDKETAGR